LRHLVVNPSRWRIVLRPTVLVFALTAMAAAAGVLTSGEAAYLGDVKTLTASDGEAQDNFGSGVAIDGETAVVAAVDQLVGSAYIFERNLGGAGAWGEARKVTSPSQQTFAYFGFTVAIDGDAVVVGESGGGEDGSGRAYIYERERGGPDNWGLARTLVSSDGAGAPSFGSGVAISGNTVLVGASGAAPNTTGAAYVFERDAGGAGNWGEVRKITASDGQPLDSFGRGVALSGDTAVVGAEGATIGGLAVGAAYVFERNQGGADNWGEVKKLIASDGQFADLFGEKIAIDGDTAFIGARGKDYMFMDAGAAYIFERNRGGPDNWGEVRMFASPDPNALAEFGGSVAINDDTAIGRRGIRRRCLCLWPRRGRAGQLGPGTEAREFPQRIQGRVRFRGGH
jgi:hypothetical protein